PPLVRRLLAQRGISGREMAEKYLRPRLQHLGDPFELDDLEQAVDRILHAVDEGQYICIYGDYDVDGVSSVALLNEVLAAYGVQPHCFIPVRTKEGYGLSKEGIERAIAGCARRPDLIITVDCGSSSVDEIRFLQEQGIDVVVIDHHEGGTQGRPPAVAVVNAKMQAGCELTYLCSAGVVFKLAHGLLKKRRLANFDLRQYLDVVAIATVADIVPLVAENRLLTRYGLRVLEQGSNLGLQALNEVVGMKRSPNSSHVSFRLGPRINAAGRMDCPQDALELLMTHDVNRAQFLAQRLDQYNQARQQEEGKIRQQAIQILEANFDPKRDLVVVLGSRQWHPGVVGIVASLIMRRYYRPTFIISLDENGIGKGSGRSIPGVSLVKAIHACADTIISGGGHDMAAGLMVAEDRIDDFREAFNEYVRQSSSRETLKPVLMIDAEVDFPELTLDLLDSYELLEPFGNSNPQPVFMTRGVMLNCPPTHMQGNHLRLRLRQGNHEREAMYFNGGGRFLPDPPWDISFTIDRNTWRGRSSLSISIQDIRSAED
ncbi:MAG: single-stranded-DNA-specific exonuclease RecJ, partial [Akkermansia sp.]